MYETKLQALIKQRINLQFYTFIYVFREETGTQKILKLYHISDHLKFSLVL
jgi:hypothetical protein